MSDQEDIVLPSHLQLFINGEWVDGASMKTFQVVSPNTAKVIATVAEADSEDVDKAVKAARSALNGEWNLLGAVGRRNLLLKLADLLEKHGKELGKLESYNNGGPLSFQTAVVESLPNDLRYYAGWAEKIDGRIPSGDGNQTVLVHREPLGVCGIIIPWNVPLWALVTKLGPCLAAGNTAVIKPAEQTPLTALRFTELAHSVGIPAGVINIVTGYGKTGSALSHHMDVDKIAFTGSTEVGRLIMKASADSNLKRVQLELGGKAPLVVFPDVDLGYAVELAGVAVFANNGQLCISGSRTFVHKSIYDEFVKRAVERANGLGVGHSFTSHVGPVADKDQFEKVLKYIELGKKEGARLECGGVQQQGKDGYFIQPTVFSNVKDDMAIAKEEIFGPVQSIFSFETMEEVIQRCNASPYGLSAGIITNDINKVFHFSKQIKSGTVWVNTYLVISPYAEFGGFKQSGFGREGGYEGIHEWVQTKTVVIQTSKV